MSNSTLRELAINLRLEGNTYGQIKQSLGVSKSTLSGWLRNLDLTEDQMLKLHSKRGISKELRIEKYRRTRKIQRLNRLKAVLSEQSSFLLPLSDKELFLSGLFLYWGEGEKKHGRVCISNSDPRLVKFALYWMTKSLGIPKEDVDVYLHLYKDMSVEESIEFWAPRTGAVKKSIS